MASAWIGDCLGPHPPPPRLAQKIIDGPICDPSALHASSAGHIPVVQKMGCCYALLGYCHKRAEVQSVKQWHLKPLLGPFLGRGVCHGQGGSDGVFQGRNWGMSGDSGRGFGRSHVQKVLFLILHPGFHLNLHPLYRWDKSKEIHRLSGGLGRDKRKSTFPDLSQDFWSHSLP